MTMSLGVCPVRQTPRRNALRHHHCSVAPFGSTDYRGVAGDDRLRVGGTPDRHRWRALRQHRGGTAV